MPNVFAYGKTRGPGGRVGRGGRDKDDRRLLFRNPADWSRKGVRKHQECGLVQRTAMNFGGF